MTTATPVITATWKGAATLMELHLVQQITATGLHSERALCGVRPMQGQWLRPHSERHCPKCAKAARDRGIDIQPG